jgi:hypothetical protein
LSLLIADFRLLIADFFSLDSRFRGNDEDRSERIFGIELPPEPIVSRKPAIRNRQRQSSIGN